MRLTFCNVILFAINSNFVKFDSDNPAWSCNPLKENISNPTIKSNIRCDYIICSICYNKRQRKTLTPVASKMSNNSKLSKNCQHEREHLNRYTDFYFLNDRDNQETFGIKNSCSICSLL